VAILPDFLIAQDLVQGRLRRVLPDWQVEPVGVFAVWPPNARRGGLTARFLDHLVHGVAAAQGAAPQT